MAGGAYLDLAERMRARHAYVPAERHYSRALEQPGDAEDPRRFSAYRGRGLMRYRIGRHHARDGRSPSRLLDGIECWVGHRPARDTELCPLPRWRPPRPQVFLTG